MHLDTLVQLQRESCARYAERPCLGTKRHDGWRWTTFGELGQLVDDFRGALASLGVERGTRVAIISSNRLEWAVAFYATVGLEAIAVPMYEAQTIEDWTHILADSGAAVAVVASGAIEARVSAARASLPALQHLVVVDEPPAGALAFTELLARGRAAPVEARAPSPDTVAAFMYTSGTTARPKGVVLTHRNLASNVSATSEVFALTPDDRSLSFLPWAHLLGQIELHYVLAHGASAALNDELPHLLPNLAEVRPTLLVTVPRVFNRVYNAVKHDIGKRPAFIQRLLDGGIRAAMHRTQGQRLGLVERIELSLDERLLFRKVRQKLGGRLRYVISGSAALNPEVAEFVDAVGLPVYEGYGLSETSPIVTANTPGQRKLGSVGKPIPGVRVVLDRSVGHDERGGEIIVYGPNVMLGYHDRPEETARTFTPDGGLRTGDVGYFDDDGFLYISGRIKDRYKLENGKFVMPEQLEECLRLSPFIAQALVYGANRPYNVALVVPDRAAIAAWAGEQGITIGELAHDPAVQRLIEGEVAKAAHNWRPFDVPKRVLVTDDEFTLENGLLTPTLKLKRGLVEKRYERQLAALFEPPPRWTPTEQRVA